MNPSASKYPDERTVVAYLKALGLDPTYILATGWDRTGYLQWKRNPDGSIATMGGQLLTERVDWPENFDYNFFVAITSKVGRTQP